jgi:hypothetical protein
MSSDDEENNDHERTLSASSEIQEASLDSSEDDLISSEESAVVPDRLEECEQQILETAADLFGRSCYKKKERKDTNGIAYRDSGCMSSVSFGINHFKTDEFLVKNFLSMLGFEELNQVDEEVSVH